ncbi:universal stress protein [Deinococcus misasensis]|uniref:universal stress protein n=1 Tax=Deinococcus misasensis TaxID=392413 RepID=UPI000555B443|nr:universal stress protein [Deinococcus misasensis]
MTRILVPTDFSEGAHKALKLARELMPEAQIKLVHVFNPEVRSLPYQASLGIQANREDAEKHFQDEVLAQFEEAQRANMETEVVVGHPVEAIVESARLFGADYIFMGTHARKGLNLFFLGSVAQGVMQRTPVPVMVVPSHD